MVPRRYLIIHLSIAERMWTRRWPVDFANVFLEMNHQIRISCPCLQPLLSRKGFFAQAKWTVCRTNEGMTVSDRSTPFRTNRIKMLCEMGIPFFFNEPS